jgi:non-specific serine/threonine protein kinase/serine/threonine-protein kinase
MDSCSPTRTGSDDDPGKGPTVDDRGLVAGKLIAGRYRIVEPIGHGGMGEVWLAEQEAPVRRKVAFKVIKLGMDTQQVVTRFEAERQALAKMDHPAVAKVFDAGFTPGGRPFFVMEYVTGVPITRYCDDHRLTTRERLKLFQQVCGGVQHAHHKTIIHRDLKPSNVLVAQQDGDPLPKIIDFGIAKATGLQPGEETMHTQLGVIIGTPEYMSPEQALGEDVDTRTDVYALGVMLYEMLVGELPFDSEGLRKGGYDSLRRKICEEEPLRPSTRFRSLGDGRSSGLAESRHTDPSTLQRDLRRDLDWVTMKTLEKDRARRYSSPAELAADVQRHLDHLPVTARPPSVSYRTGKFVRRHRWGVAAGILLCLALIAGTIGTAVGLVRATHETQKARAVTDHLVGILSEANPEKAQGRSVTVQEAMDASSQKVAESFVGQPALEMEVRVTMALVYHEMGSYDEAEEHLRRAALLAERELGPRDKFTVRVRGRLGRTLMDAGRFDEAELEMRTLLPVFRKQYGDKNRETLSLMHNLAAVYLHQKRYDQAEPLLRDVTKGQREVLGVEHTDTQSVVANLAQLFMFTERYDEAEPLLQEGLAVRRSELGDQHPRTLISVFNLGDLYHRMGRNVEAEGLMREALEGFRVVVGEDHPYTLETLGGLAGTVVELDRLGEAEELALESYRLRNARFGADHPLTIEAAELLVEIYERTGRDEQAARFRRQPALGS